MCYTNTYLCLTITVSLYTLPPPPSYQAEQKREKGLAFHHFISTWQYGLRVLCLLGTEIAQLVSSCSYAVVYLIPSTITP